MLCRWFVVNADAWKLLCARLALDPEVLLRELPGFQTVRQMEEIARHMAFTPEEALSYLEERGKAGEVKLPLERGSRLATAEDVVRSMQEQLARHPEQWS
jgi:hypothetical protein